MVFFLGKNYAENGNDDIREQLRNLIKLSKI